MLELNSSYLAISIILICVAIFGYSFYIAKTKVVGGILLIVIGGLILRIYVSRSQFLHQWDEKYHALVAKNMISHPLKPTLYDWPVLDYDSNKWTANHIWLAKGPVPLLAISSSLAVFGNSEYAVRIPSILMGCIAIFMTFLIGKWLFNEKIGLMAAFFHAINGMILELIGGRISSDHVESSFIFFVELGVLLSVFFVHKKQSYFISLGIGFCIGLAFLSKWFPAALVFPVWLLPVFFSKKLSVKSLLLHISICLIGTGILIIPYIYYVYNAFPQEIESVMFNYLNAYSTSDAFHRGSWYFYFNCINMLFGEIVLIAVVIYTCKALKSNDIWRQILIHSWWLIPTVVFSIAQTKRATYLLIAAPAFFIMASYAYYFLKNISFSGYKKWFVSLVMIAIVVLPIRYSFERLKPFQRSDINLEESMLAKSFSDLPYNPKTDIIFNVEFAIEAMFYSNYTVYKNYPTPLQIKQLHSKRLNCILFQKDSVNQFIMLD
jgi:4-amino-4-deoxy-L-arabinose transferase